MAAKGQNQRNVYQFKSFIVLTISGMNGNQRKECSPVSKESNVSFMQILMQLRRNLRCKQ